MKTENIEKVYVIGKRKNRLHAFGVLVLIMVLTFIKYIAERHVDLSDMIFSYEYLAFFGLFSLYLVREVFVCRVVTKNERGTSSMIIDGKTMISIQQDEKIEVCTKYL